MEISLFDRNATKHDIMFIAPKNSTKITNLYYINNRDTEMVAEYIKPSVGDLACKYGQTTGHSCGIITQVEIGGSALHVCPASFFGKKCEATYIAMRGSSLKGAKGDSGGPVYIIKDNKRYPTGIISSGANTAQGAITVFSPLTHLGSMGIKLKVR